MAAFCVDRPGAVAVKGCGDGPSVLLIASECRPTTWFCGAAHRGGAALTVMVPVRGHAQEARDRRVRAERRVGVVVDLSLMVTVPDRQRQPRPVMLLGSAAFSVNVVRAGVEGKVRHAGGPRPGNEPPGAPTG